MKYVVASVIFLSTISQVNACMVSYRPILELKSEAEMIVLARVVSINGRRALFRSKVYEYSIKVITDEKGVSNKKQWIVFYEDLMVHRRGALIVCPRKHGSGIESSLSVNQLYRFFIRSSTDLEILLAEKV